MTTQYQPPLLASTNLNNLYQEGDRRDISGGSHFNKWTAAERKNAVYYGKLTNYLLYVFSVVCVIRAIALSIQTSQSYNCPTITTNQVINVINYILFALLFMGSTVAISQRKTNILDKLVILCWVNLLYKLVATIILGSTNDLLGECYLVVHFKAWTWVFGTLETIFFAFMVLRLRNVLIKQQKAR